jgi:hypothetical protein
VKAPDCGTTDGHSPSLAVHLCATAPAQNACTGWESIYKESTTMSFTLINGPCETAECTSHLPDSFYAQQPANTLTSTRSIEQATSFSSNPTYTSTTSSFPTSPIDLPLRATIAVVGEDCDEVSAIKASLSTSLH